MDTACYYTFSTICQTLAGAFGFLVAVVLYQIQTIVKVLDGEYPTIICHWNFKDNNAIQTARRLGHWSEVARCFREAKLSSNYDHAELQQEAHRRNRAAYLSDIEGLESIKKGLDWSLRTTGVTIGSSLVLLMLTPVISCRWWLAIPFLLVCVVAACYCLWTYFPLVRNVTK